MPVRPSRSKLLLGLVAALVASQVALVAPAIAAGPAPTSVAGSPRPAACTPRLLVLGSMPSEIGMLLAATKLDPAQPVTRRGRHFFVGRLEGSPVIVGMVGTGLVNAHDMIEAALNGFSCIDAVVYSGVAGAGQGSQIGDVTVASRWTLDNGKTWMPTDNAMMAVARVVAPSVHLQRTTPLGSPGCACQPDTARTVTLTHVPRIIVGGARRATTASAGRRSRACQAAGTSSGASRAPSMPRLRRTAGRSITAAVSFASLQELESNLGPPASPSEHGYEASDNETAAADQVAQHHNLPFIAFRAISDGSPDPLLLPGYPSQFFVYYQLAAENAQLAALAFIRHWPLAPQRRP